MNVKPTLTLLDIGLKQCFIKFSFHFEGVLLVVRGCTFILRGCSRTLKTLNSPPLASHALASTMASVTDLLHKARPWRKYTYVRFEIMHIYVPVRRHVWR